MTVVPNQTRHIHRATLPAMLIALVAPAFSARAETLLHSYSLVTGDGWSFLDPNGYVYTKAKPHLLHTAPGYGSSLPLGRPEAPWWRDGETGSFDFTPGTATNFAAFASGITDGQLGGVYFRHMVTGDDEALFAYKDEFLLESDLFGTASDLVGFDITRIRMVLHAMDFYVDTDGRQHSEATLTWEFYGNPIPEPATFAYVGATALALLRRRRKSNR